MVTALDTNVLVTLLRADEPGDLATAQRALEAASAEGRLVLSPVVFAELSASPGVTGPFLDAFLKETGIAVEWRLPQGVWRDAARAFAEYAARRRKAANDPGPRRILADFVIGAHAAHWADGLVTFDRGIHRAAFPGLDVTVLEAVRRG